MQIYRRKKNGRCKMKIKSIAAICKKSKQVVLYSKRVIKQIKNSGLQKLEKAGYITGHAAAIVADSFRRGISVGRAEITEMRTGEVQKESVQPCDLTEGSVCRECWCNTCDKLLNGCDAFPPSLDGTCHNPCAECRSKDCAPLMPKVHPAECGTYRSVPEDCAACWCVECANFEQCRVSKAGYYPEVGLCPCVGCEPGMIYMPQEKPPTCGQFQTRFER